MISAIYDNFEYYKNNIESRFGVEINFEDVRDFVTHFCDYELYARDVDFDKLQIDDYLNITFGENDNVQDCYMTFCCENCKSCTNCYYCSDCRKCFACVDCYNCVKCKVCNDCELCSNASYMVSSYNCHDCTDERPY